MLIRSERLHWRIADVPVGPSLLYLPVREWIEIALGEAVALAKDERAVEEATVSRRLGNTPREIERRMMDVVAKNPLLTDNQRSQRIGSIRGAMMLETNDDRLRRLFELIADYRMRSLRKRLLRPRGKKRP